MIIRGGEGSGYDENSVTLSHDQDLPVSIGRYTRRSVVFGVANAGRRNGGSTERSVLYWRKP